MPSGAKKRKAAKNKMKNQSTRQPNPSSSTHTNGDDVKNGNGVESEVGGEQVGNGSNGKDEQLEINESTKTGKSMNGSSSESSGSSSSDDESRVSEISSTKVDDSLAGGIHIYGKEEGVPDVESESPSIEKMGEALGLSSSGDDNYMQKEDGGISHADNVVLSTDFKDTASEKAVNGEVIQTVKETTVILEPEECMVPEIDDRSILAHNVAGANADEGVEHVDDVGVTEPLLKPSQRPVVEKTTWKSCCGLFELFGK